MASLKYVKIMKLFSQGDGMLHSENIYIILYCLLGQIV